ncbi:MAG TPA: hypothetical protein DIU37_05370 [Opitutae bacterium]|nr:hypothetical protein [Opitutae bacterium]|tara:strand:+ start:649 stop:1809 length:1161 start_codon:yes stop_codon:yes gene_type:complete
MDIPHAVLVGLGLVPSTGGPPKTMGLFKKALGADVVSFTSPQSLENEGSAIEDTVHVPIARGLRGRGYSFAEPSALVPAEELVSKAGLLSCHILYRYHVHWVRRMAVQHRIPYWVVPHGCLDPYVFTYRGWVKKLWFQWIGKPFLKHAAHIICATEAERRKLRRYYEGDNLRVVHWPVIPMDTSQRTVQREALRKKLGIPQDARVLLYLGRLHPMKRPLETIQVIARAYCDNVHLIVVGPEERYTVGQCQDYADAVGAKNVHVVGPAFGEGKNAYCLASDGFISLSIRENFGHTAAESLTAELPLILSPGNDLAPELAPLHCGWMLQDDRLETAVNAVRDFATVDPADLEARGKRGQAWALEELSFERFSYKIRMLAQEAVKQPRA